jgi:hypothetical protein
MKFVVHVLWLNDALADPKSSKLIFHAIDATVNFFTAATRISPINFRQTRNSRHFIVFKVAIINAKLRHFKRIISNFKLSTFKISKFKIDSEKFAHT